MLSPCSDGQFNSNRSESRCEAGYMDSHFICFHYVFTHDMALYPPDSALSTYEPVRNFISNIRKGVWKNFSLIYILFAIHLGSMVLQIFAKYIHILNMPETPEIVIVSLISFVCIYCARSGPEGIGRISKFTWPILTASIVITCIIAMKDMNLNYLKPVMNTDFKVLLIGGYSMCALPLGESFLCFSLFSSLSPKVKPQKFL